MHNRTRRKASASHGVTPDAADNNPNTNTVQPPVAAAVVDERTACRYLGLSSAYLRQARMYRRGPAFMRIGRTIRYRLADLDTWLLSHRIDTHEHTA